MIFLMKNRKYVVVDSAIDDDKKAVKWYRKHKESIGAVMIDCSSRLHSDCYTIVYGDRFIADTPKTQIWYSIALLEDDMPFQDCDCIHRYIECTTPSQFYNAAALLYQIDQSNVVGDPSMLGTKFTELVTLSIQQSPMGEPVKWDRVEKLKDFLERFDLVLNTDKIMAMPEPVVKAKRQEDVKNGFYLARPTGDGGTHMSYQWYDAKYMIRLNGGYWTLEDDDFHWDILDTEILGVCMNNTGLLYLGSGKIIFNLLDCESCHIDVCYKNPHDHNVYVADYDAYNTADVLYMALFLSQIWDVIYYYETNLPEAVSISLMFNKHYELKETIVLPKPEPEGPAGIEMDLFACLAALINSGHRRDISFDD